MVNKSSGVMTTGSGWLTDAQTESHAVVMKINLAKILIMMV